MSERYCQEPSQPCYRDSIGFDSVDDVAGQRDRLSILDQHQKLSARSPLMLFRRVISPPGCVEPHAEHSFAAQRGGEIAYLAATFAPATKSNEGTREKLETQDHSRGVPNCGGLAQRALFWRFGREFRLVAAAQAFI